MQYFNHLALFGNNPKFYGITSNTSAHWQNKLLELIRSLTSHLRLRKTSVECSAVTVHCIDTRPEFIMDVGRIFASGGGIVDFSRGSKKDFRGGSGKISFYPPATKKTTFFAKNLIRKFQIPGGAKAPFFRRPCTERVVNKNLKTVTRTFCQSRAANGSDQKSGGQQIS